MKRAIVTGGAGFIGSHIVDALLGSGSEVMVLDNLSTGRSENLDHARKQWGSKLLMLEVSICSEQAADAVRDFQPEAVFHLAAQMNVRKSVEAPPFDAQENVLGTVNVLEAARASGASRFIFSSTGGAIYGEQDYFPADEQHPIRPKCPYGVSKRCAELYLEYYAREYGMQCLSMRFANVYGPRQNPFGEAGVVAIFARKGLRGETLRINGDGTQTRDFVYVGDVVRACLTAAAAELDEKFDVFNVGTGREASILDLVHGFRSVWGDVGAAAALKVEHGPALAGEQQRSVIDAGKLARKLGCKPQMSLEEGLLGTILSFRE